MWTRAYNNTGFANAEKRLFGKINYEFYIGTFRGLPGFQQVSEGDFIIPPTKDFAQDNPVLEFYYNSHIYLL
jgi:hypothetical protein